MKTELPKGVKLGEILPDVLRTMREKLYKHLKDMGITTGFKKWDQITGGIQPLDLWVVASRPNVGKSALMIQMALAALKQGKKVLFFSLEMTNEQVIQRMIVNDAQMSGTFLRTGGDKLTQVEKMEFERLLSEAEARFEKYKDNLIMIDQKMLNIDDLIAIAEAYKGQYDTIYIDYLQLLIPMKKNQPRHLEIGEITGKLKALSQKVGAPVVAGAQVNRGPASSKKSDQRKPGLSDIRESGCIEQDADLVAILDRKRDDDGCFMDVGPASITIEKARDSGHGVINTVFIGEQFRFEEEIPIPHWEGSEMIQKDGPDGSLEMKNR